MYAIPFGAECIFRGDSLFAFVRYCPSLSAGPAIDLLSALMNNGVACFFFKYICNVASKCLWKKLFIVGGNKLLCARFGGREPRVLRDAALLIRNFFFFFFFFYSLFLLRRSYSWLTTARTIGGSPWRGNGWARSASSWSSAPSIPFPASITFCGRPSWPTTEASSGQSGSRSTWPSVSPCS